MIYDDIYKVFGDDDAIITIEETSELLIIEQVTKNTFPLYPIASQFFRPLQDDVNIC